MITMTGKSTFYKCWGHFILSNQAEIDLLKNLIDSAKVPSNDATILSIIEECSEMYFVGDATVESAAKQIQGRV